MGTGTQWKPDRHDLKVGDKVKADSNWPRQAWPGKRKRPITVTAVREDNDGRLWIQLEGQPDPYRWFNSCFFEVVEVG